MPVYIMQLLSIVVRELKIDSGPDAQKWGREIDLSHILAV